MAKQKKADKADKKRKSGQNMAYKAELRHEKGHIRRLKVHLGRYGYAKDAADALMRYATRVGLHATNSATEFLKGTRHADA